MTIIIVDDHGDWRDTIAEFIHDLGLGEAILTAGSLAELDQLLLSVTPGILVLDAMLPSITKTSDLVQEISAASEEQASGVGQINTAMTQLNQITQQNASSSEELAATSEEMSSQAEQLQQAMSFFTVTAANASPHKAAPHRAAVAGKPQSHTPAHSHTASSHAHAASSPAEAEFTRF